MIPVGPGNPPETRLYRGDCLNGRHFYAPESHASQEFR